ncbi:hypothetical protein XENORESO_019722 [Xenotaenia resolanae]|uniref:Uncharacterized protein n=1 Tax=Xenotaenia resolanae TaxID=208358 RepID=A0ABV0WWI5_9TELE
MHATRFRFFFVKGDVHHVSFIDSDVKVLMTEGPAEPGNGLSYFSLLNQMLWSRNTNKICRTPAPGDWECKNQRMPKVRGKYTVPLKFLVFVLLLFACLTPEDDLRPIIQMVVTFISALSSYNLNLLR